MSGSEFIACSISGHDVWDTIDAFSGAACKYARHCKHLRSLYLHDHDQYPLHRAAKDLRAMRKPFQPWHAVTTLYVFS